MLPKRWFPLRPHPIQHAYWISPARFIALPCGRRSGKTELSKRKLVYWLAVDRGHGQIHQYRAAAPTLSQARDLFWEDIKQLTPPSWITEINESRMEIHTRVYNVEACLKVIGLEKAQRAEGMGYDGIVIDESSDVRPGIWARTIMPALADRSGWAVRQGVPKRFGVGAIEYREFCELGFSGKDSHIAAFTWPSWTVLPQEEIDLQRRILSEDDFNEQFGAVWLDIATGAFHFDEQVHVRPCSYDKTRPLLVGVDFNVTPMAWTLNQSDGQTLETVDELWLTNTWTQQTLDTLWARYSDHQGGWQFFGDATGNARSTNAPASNYATIKNDKRFKATIRVPAANPNVADRLASVNALLRNASGDVRWHIDPRCIHLINDLKKRPIDPDTGGAAEGKAGEEIGHISDAAGYLIHYQWPSTRLTPSEAKVGFVTLD